MAAVEAGEGSLLHPTTEEKNKVGEGESKQAGGYGEDRGTAAGSNSTSLIALCAPLSHTRCVCGHSRRTQDVRRIDIWSHRRVQQTCNFGRTVDRWQQRTTTSMSVSQQESYSSRAFGERA